MLLLMLLNIPLLATFGHFIIYLTILCVSICHFKKIRKQSQKGPEMKLNQNQFVAPNQSDLLTDFDGNSTDIDMFYESKVKIEMQKNRNSNTTDWSAVDSVTDGNSSVPVTPAKNPTVHKMSDLPQMILEVNEANEEEVENIINKIHDEDRNNQFIMNQKYINKPEKSKCWDLCCKDPGKFLQFLVYIIDQSTYFGSIFVYISYSKCSYITTSNFDLYYILFILSIFIMIFYKCLSSLSISIITRNCMHFILQWFDLLIYQQCFWSPDHSNNKEQQNENVSLWIKGYLQSIQSLFGSLPQMLIGIVFLCNQTHYDFISNVIVCSSILSSLTSLVYFSASNVKIQQSFGVYVCRFLEITSRIILLILIWKYFGTFILSIIVFLELIYLIICAISSHNILLIGNITYSIIDVYGKKKSRFFIRYRIISSYFFGGVIALLSIAHLFQNININNLSPQFLAFFEVTNYDQTQHKHSRFIDDQIWFYLFVYCFGVQPIYQLLFLCKYKESLLSIGQCSHFQQLLTHKCYQEIYQLMQLGSNYTNIAQHNQNNILCQICMESETRLIHLKIGDLYLRKYRDTFISEDHESRFYLPFFYAIQLSSIRMMRLLISHGADIEHLFDNENWCNSLQAIITSRKPSMNKIQFIIKMLQQKYHSNPHEYDEKIGSFLNYQNGNNYDTALLMLYWTNDYQMMDKGFDRLEAMEYLIWNGANPNVADKNKCNILHYAIEQKEYRVIKMLIKNGADILIENGYKQTPLSIACRVKCDNLEIIKLLLYGTMNIFNLSSSKLFRKCSYSNSGILSSQQDTKLIDKPDTYGRSALHYAACHCCSDVIKYLIDRNGDCSIKDNDGLTPLHYAIRYNPNDLQVDIIILLIAVGKSDLNSIDNNKCSILHDAAKYQSIDIIDYLIKTGANIHHLDSNGHTPKFYSVGREDEYEVMEYWKEIYLNNDVFEEIISAHHYHHDDKKKQCGEDDDYDEEYESELSSIHQLEAFRSIISSDDSENDNDNQQIMAIDTANDININR